MWPQGILSQLLREAAGRRPGMLTRVGDCTYLDPRMENESRAQWEVLPKVLRVEDDEWLLYPAPKFDVAIVRATTADEAGNLTFEHEGVVLDALDAAQAARVCRGDGHCAGEKNMPNG